MFRHTRSHRPLSPFAALAALAALALSGCSGGGGSGATFNADDRASLTISLMDSPIDDVTAVYVEITDMWIKAEGDGPAERLDLTESPITVNLLGLTEDNAAILVDGELVDPGTYEWLAMDVNAAIDNIFDSYVETDTGQTYEIRVPSSRVRLVDGFDVEANAALQLVFDWDLRKGLVYPPGLGGRDTTAFILKPAFRVIGMEVFGRLSGSILVSTVTLEENACNDDVDDGNFDTGNAVYIFEGHDVVPDDFDEEMDVEPLASVDAEISNDGLRYEYTTLLPYGDYTVAFTCQAAADFADTNETGNADPDDDTVAFFEPPVNITLSSAMDETNVVVDF